MNEKKLVEYSFHHQEIKDCDYCPFLDWEQNCFCQLSDKSLRKNAGFKIPIPEWCELMGKELNEVE